MMSSRFAKYLTRPQGQVTSKKIGWRYLTQGTYTEKGQRQIPREKPAVRRRSPGGGGYPLLIIPLTTFGLGTWQVYRREWKINLIKELEDKMKAPPISLPQNLEDVKDMEYKKVKVRGTFDHSKELYIGPRSNIHDPETLGHNRAATIGVNVVTPFKLADRDETILVNRGHVTFKDRPPQMRPEGQVEGEVEITGVIRLNEKKSAFGGDPRKDGYWLTRDIDEMADIVGTEKVFIDADINSTVPGGPQGGQTRVALRNEHMSYIITWYALTVLTFYLWYKNYRTAVPHKAVLDYVKKQHKRL